MCIVWHFSVEACVPVCGTLHKETLPYMCYVCLSVAPYIKNLTYKLIVLLSDFWHFLCDSAPSVVNTTE